ncbi:phosphatase [Bailinhaonella thermotolerans]|uniref:Phosphatase n=1 Tax=Bailinhaonella thermotolerans TaxID=1070861 RepID=A0A3A4A996_9ACTN|nr:phosphatase [Bailinhaonella thermotolerans]RJL22535.1 phosphatase [Bailinhaonella thermotolerans]
MEGSRVPSRDELREHLVRTRVAGDIATTRENNLDNFRSLANRDPRYTFGLTFSGEWTYPQILDLMAKRCGVIADPAHREGADTIDPDLTIDALDAMADRLGDAVRRGARIVVATGHPTGLLTIHLAIARAAVRHGARLLTPAEGSRYRMALGRVLHLRYLGGVGMVSDGAGFLHTHEPGPMRGLLESLDELPDLVLADHGWAGAAGEAGVETVVGFADCNDPALFVGEAEGKVTVTVPLDDNVYPVHYAPLTAYLLGRMGLPVE